MPQTKTGNVCVTLPPLKYVITKSSMESANPSSAAASIAGAMQRERDLAKGGDLVRAEVHRGLLEMPVEPDQARLHGDDDEADDEHHVRDEDRHEPELEDGGRVQEEREQRRAEHDLGRGHRQEDEQVRRPAPDEPMADDRHAR